MNITMRLLKKEELNLVREVADVVWPITFQNILSPDQIAYMMNMMYSPSVMEQEYDDGIVFSGVFDDNRPIGYFIWGRYDGPKKIAKLHKCYLLPEYQGKGIGYKMLTETKHAVQAAGYEKLRLNVNRENKKAIMAYERNGFVTIKSVDNPIGRGYFMNDYVMEVDISQKSE